MLVFHSCPVAAAEGRRFFICRLSSKIGVAVAEQLPGSSSARLSPDRLNCA